MHKQLLIIVITVLSLMIVFSGCIQEKSSGIVIEGKGSYTSIQNAIDSASNGDTILVYNGTYHETLIIDKSINLIGSGDGEKIINYNANESNQSYIILITADNCKIKGFKIINSYYSSNSMGISIESSNNVISTNTILNTEKGIYIERDSANNNVLGNNIFYNQYGINTEYSDSNNISKNNIYLNSLYGIYIYSSDNNIVTDNIISDGEYGIRIKGSENNEIFRNLIFNNQRGMYFCCGAHNNIMYYNAFEQNSEFNAYDSLSNQCNNGSVGNYWDDYTEKYPDATELDGIWNTPYDISGGNQDKYPLVKPVII